MPFDLYEFDLVASLDVVCALERDDVQPAFQQMWRVLKPGGSLVLNLPAYPWLYSGHDAFVGNRTRFFRSELVHMLKACGFEIKMATYRNSLLCPLAIVARFMKPLFSGPDGAYASDVKMPPRLVNWAFLNVLRLENRIIQSGLRLPFGLSIFVVARKPDLGAYQFTAAVASQTG